ncbi:LysR family transcriptional regulator [Pseudomonas sp. SJZ079]|uniref:LysR family transcriptional regulator n=1 Tax=Pseudomonas sp. SJZ079 TaxID=2572887 RepID=UPI001198F314|nr:LysR family transcriptional regulator [Pseudomonas sp. SJZ079]TWC29760.1 LysR family transcriptional regulator [Pseudomonas sp. SJZ079]
METLSSLECFVRSAEAGSFAEAARRLALTPAAVGKQVAKLEASLGVRLFQRSTRSLTLTEAGERFLADVRGGLTSIQNALANLASSAGQPAGMLKVSMGVTFGRDYVLPMLGDFLRRYPAISPDWHFDNGPVDLIGQGFDAAISGAMELSPGVVARKLAPAHRILVASPAYLEDHPGPATPAELARHAGILIRSPQTGRVRSWALRNRSNDEAAIELPVRITMSDPDAACRAAEMGLGIALVSLPHSLPYLDTGSLIRVLPDWYVDAGHISVYFSGHNLLPAKTRAFVDSLVEHFSAQQLVERFSALCA